MLVIIRITLLAVAVFPATCKRITGSNMHWLKHGGDGDGRLGPARDQILPEQILPLMEVRIPGRRLGMKAFKVTVKKFRRNEREIAAKLEAERMSIIKDEEAAREAALRKLSAKIKKQIEDSRLKIKELETPARIMSEKELSETGVQRSWQKTTEAVYDKKALVEMHRRHAAEWLEFADKYKVERKGLFDEQQKELMLTKKKLNPDEEAVRQTLRKSIWGNKEGYPAPDNTIEYKVKQEIDREEVLRKQYWKKFLDEVNAKRNSDYFLNERPA